MTQACSLPPDTITQTAECAPRGPSVPWFVPAPVTGLDFNYVFQDFRGGALTVFDWNDDGYFDLALASRMGLLQVFENHGDFRFSDITENVGLADISDATYIAAADLDNDSDQDVMVAMGQELRVFERSGNGYALRTKLAVGNTEHVLPVDINADGFLDLYVSNHDFYQPALARNQMYVRNGDFAWTDVAQSLGMDSAGLSFTATAWDSNRDGLVDIYVANDTLVADISGRGTTSKYQGDRLFVQTTEMVDKNLKIQGFTDSSRELGLAELRSSMGGNVFDANGDGYYDLLIPDFGPSKLFLWNEHAQKFDDRAWAMGLPIIRSDGICTKRRSGFEPCEFFTWGTSAFDADQDGYEDLFLANGQSAVPPGPFPPLLALRGGPDRFTEVDIGASCLERHGLGFADLDNDGDLELLAAPHEGPLEIFENQSNGHFLRVHLQGRLSNRDGRGAEIVLRTSDGKIQRRLVGAGGLVHTSLPPHVFFGLGQASPVEIQVNWPSGKVSHSSDVVADSTMLLVE